MRLEVISRQPSANAPPRPAPILFVHGAWHGAWTWTEYFLPYFADHGYSAHALSLRGHGGSEGREKLRWHSIADYVADVKQVADTLSAPPIIVGHSMGGFVAQKYLEQHPAPAGVLIATAPPAGILGFSLRYLTRHPLTYLRAVVTTYLLPLVGTPQRAREVLFTARTPASLIDKTLPNLQNESYRANLDLLLFNLPRPARVKAPVMVIGAADDGIFTPAEQRATARAYHTEAIIVGDTGHNMMIEASWQTTADHILNWLNEQGL
jgi:pimeloyl-ACP methyl ester carboxylesterase